MHSLIISCLAAAMGVSGTPFDFAAHFAVAQPSDEQGEARKEMQAGNVLPLREIERKVLPTMRGAEYLGPAYDSTAMAYRLKFIRDGRVVYVDVDAKTGRILGRSK